MNITESTIQYSKALLSVRFTAVLQQRVVHFLTFTVAIATFLNFFLSTAEDTDPTTSGHWPQCAEYQAVQFIHMYTSMGN
jgi:hypothetical protein